MKLNISLSHTRVKGQAATPHEILLAIINQSERSAELILYLFFINNVKLKLYIKISTTDFLKKPPPNPKPVNFDHYGNFCFSSLENNMTHGPFFKPDFSPLQPAVRKPQKVLERAQEMAGSNLKEKKKSWGTRQLLVAECYFFFSLCLHIFTTCVLCYPVTSLSSLGKYLCFGIKEGPGVLLVRTALALICCFWTEHIQWTHFKLGPLPS